MKGPKNGDIADSGGAGGNKVRRYLKEATDRVFSGVVPVVPETQG